MGGEPTFVGIDGPESWWNIEALSPAKRNRGMALSDLRERSSARCCTLDKANGIPASRFPAGRSAAIGGAMV
jgi:uncharacterized protein (DUF2126 family)